MSELTKERKETLLNSYLYFWEEKQDLERDSGWDASVAAVNFPDVLHAWRSYKRAKSQMRVAIREAMSDLESYEDD